MPLQVTRKWLRYPVAWKVITCNNQPVKETLLIDISAMGARIEGPHPLHPQRHVEFSYLIPEDDRERRHAGVVRWMRPFAYLPAHYQMGVEFYQPNWSLDQQLRTWKGVTTYHR